MLRLLILLQLVLLLHLDSSILGTAAFQIVPSQQHTISHRPPSFHSTSTPTSARTAGGVKGAAHYHHGIMMMKKSAEEIISMGGVVGEQLPSQSVIDAVSKSQSSSSRSSDNNNAVLASDVAAAAGVSLSTARQDLVALAALSQARLQVSSDGELLYEFPPNLSQVLAQRSAKYKALQTFRKAWPVAFWVLRCSFGVALLASLVAIFSTIFFIQSSSSSDDNRRRDDRGFGGGGSMNWYWGPSPFDFFYYRPYGSYGYYGTAGRDYRDPDEMGFLESVFSYVFGDGNPNAGLEEQRLSLAANMIRENQGAVTAEQLAPFVDEAPSPQTVAESTYVDEAFVLPIVSALGGEPVVTDEGEIVYTFPELQKTTTTSSTAATTRNSLPAAKAREASVLKRAGMRPQTSSREIMQVLNYNGIRTPPRGGAVERSDLIDLLEEALPPPSPAEEAAMINADPTVLQEREWKFSLAPELNKVLAGGLGVVNLGGALYLGNLLNQYALYGVRLPSFMGTVQTFFPALLAYAVLFNAIPLVRNVWINQQNARIQARNQRRKSWQAALVSAINSNSRISKKLKAAARMKTKLRRIGGSKNDEIVYDTSKPIEETKAKLDQQSLKDFDKLLESDESAQSKPFQ